MKMTLIRTRPLPGWLIPLFLLLLALLIRIGLILFARFDGLYGQDPFAYLDYTRQIIARNLTGPFYWPLGYPLIAALFALLLRDPVIGGQAASVVLGSAIVPLGYGIIQELLPENDPKRREAGLGAGLILLLCGQLLQSSVVLMADVTALFWATLSAYLLLRFSRTRAAFLLPLAAIALALAIITRFLFLGLILPFGLYALFVHFRLPPSHEALSLLPSSVARRRTASRDGVPRHSSFYIRHFSFVISLILFLLILLPQLYFSQASAEPILRHAWLVNWNPLNAFRTAFDNPDGHFDYRLPPALFYAEPLFHPFYLFPLLTPFVFLGAWELRRSRALILLGGWALVLYFYLIGIPYENFRFGLAYFPPIALLAAIGLHTIALKRIQITFPPSHRVTVSPCHLVSLFILISLPFIYRGLASFLHIKAREQVAAHYLQAEIPSHATVLTFGLTLTLDHYTNFNAVELFTQSPETLRPLVCASVPVYLFVEVDNLESQWLGKAPGANFRWLRDQVGLKELGKQDSWTLYKLEKQTCDMSSFSSRSSLSFL